MSTPQTDGSAAFPWLPRNDAAQWERGTARVRAAIELRVPDSGIEWLDAMIRQRLRDDFAGQALAGLVASFASESRREALLTLVNESRLEPVECTAKIAVDFADAMLSARTNGGAS